MRPRTACTACRRRQRRCIVKKSDTACLYCMQHHVECSLTPTKQAQAAEQRSLSRSETSTPQLSPQLPPLSLRIEIVVAYFNYIHNPTQQLFHEPSFMNDVARGKVPRAILFCIVAIAARFVTHDFFNGHEPRARGEPYAREAERLLDLHEVSLQTLQQAVLLGTYYGADGDSVHENLYYTVACRLAGLLNVPNLEASSSLERESEIRLYWTLQTVDLWSSNVVHLPQVLHKRDDVPQPLPEALFLDWRRNSDTLTPLPPTISASESTTYSILAEKVKLNFIFADIAELTTASANRTLTGPEIHTTTERLAERLTTWRNQLSPWLVDTQENLAYHASRGTGGPFVAMYLGYYHFAQLLFYRWLHLPNLPDHQVSPATLGAYSYAERCRVNSTALCGTIYNAYATPGAEAYYSTVGHVLVIASTVQLHILLFSDNDAEISAARNRLERNFQILCKLQTFWRALDISLGRFQTFHEACMKSKLSSGGMSNAFRLDKWMIGFMMEFSKPMEERPEEEVVVVEDDTSVTNSQFDDIERNFAFDLHQWSVDAVGIDFQWAA